MDYISKVKQNQSEYGGIPFWSWNDKLVPEELRRQINVMHDLGMKGYFMHARGGLETEYLSDDWFDCVKACIDEGKKLDMESWAYDENGWPSGFGGGKVLDDPYNLAEYLKLTESAEFPDITPKKAPEATVLGVYVIKDGKAVKVTAPVDDKDAKYLSVVLYYDPSYVDVLDKKVIAEFIKVTHEDYKARLGDDFGKAMPGFFTDEPQYYRYETPWSKVIPDEFKKRYGYDVFEKLVALFVDCEGDKEFRYDYYYLIHDLFINAFAKQIYDWCDKNSAKLTGHAVEEATLNMQMWCCGGVMPFYEFEHMPGMDYLGRGIQGDLAPKQLGSVAAQLGKKKVLTETFACCGWDVSPTELKRIADLQYSAGVNVMCHHLYAYSIRGQRKRDYPANYSEHLPWQDAFGDFVKYYNRLGYTLSMGTENVKCLIIHPIHSAYLNYKRKEDRATVDELDNGIASILSYFSDRQISYHLGDESLLRKYGSVEGKKFKVGLMKYDYVVLPKIYTIDGSTAKLLKEFIANGGKIAFFDEKPTRIDGRTADLSWLTANTTVDDIEKDLTCTVRTADGSVANGLRAMTRDTEFGKLYYITNISDRNYDDCIVTLGGASKVSELFIEQKDFESGKAVRKVDFKKSGDKLVINTSFESGRSRLFIENPADDEVAIAEDDLKTRDASGIKLDGLFKLEKKPENALTLDFAEISKDGGATYDSRKPIIQIFDELLRSRYAGDVTMRYSFNVNEIPSLVKVSMESLNYKSVKVNGKEISFENGWWLDRSFKVSDITKLIVKGKNEIVVTFSYFQDDYVYEVLYGNVMESMRNCLVFNTEVEAMYLFGDFSVECDKDFTPNVRNSFEYTGDFALAKSKEDANVSNFTVSGFPFFAGKITVSKEFDYEGKGSVLWVKGRYSYADVTVNGSFVKRLMFTDHCDIGGFLKKGKNKLTIMFCNSNRNLLGPHHFADPEPWSVGPVTFSLENMWNNGQCPLYNPRYAFVRYGADIEIK
ncbi:MAG: hypothetical protein K6B54_00610 [Clostridia bacterium]|nr:hypothetical protein [Clostridia bacterium]